MYIIHFFLPYHHLHVHCAFSGRFPSTSGLLQYISPEGNVQFPRHDNFTLCVITPPMPIPENVVCTFNGTPAW
jgi:hypothetical protein